MKPAEKWKGRASDTYLKQNSADKHIIASGSLIGDVSNTVACTVSWPEGWKWSNNSCPFDSNLFVLYNLWRINPAAWTVVFKSFGNPWLNILANLFIHSGEGQGLCEMQNASTLFLVPGCSCLDRRQAMMIIDETVRASTGVHASRPQLWQRTHCPNLASIAACYSLQVRVTCHGLHYRNTSTTPCLHLLCTEDHSAAIVENALACVTLSRWLCLLLPFWWHLHQHHLILFCISWLLETILSIGSCVSLYYGSHHFTTHYMDPQGQVWFNDLGITLGWYALSEGPISDVELSVDKSRKEHDMFMYQSRCKT